LVRVKYRARGAISVMVMMMMMDDDNNNNNSLTEIRVLESAVNVFTFLAYYITHL